MIKHVDSLREVAQVDMRVRREQEEHIRNDDEGEEEENGFRCEQSLVGCEEKEEEEVIWKQIPHRQDTVSGDEEVVTEVE